MCRHIVATLTTPPVCRFVLYPGFAGAVPLHRVPKADDLMACVVLPHRPLAEGAADQAGVRVVQEGVAVDAELLAGLLHRVPPSRAHVGLYVHHILSSHHFGKPAGQQQHQHRHESGKHLTVGETLSRKAGEGRRPPVPPCCQLVFHRHSA